MKTIDEIKQEVAEEYGYKSNSVFSAYEQIIINPHHISHKNLSNIFDKITIRYASQFQDRIKELEEFLQVVVLDFRNEFHITLEDVVARAEELINKGKDNGI